MINESLKFSNTLYDLIFHNSLLYYSKIGYILYKYNTSHEYLYKTNKNINFISLSNEVNQLKYVEPKQMGDNIFVRFDEFNEKKMTTAKIGRIINKILSPNLFDSSFDFELDGSFYKYKMNSGKVKYYVRFKWTNKDQYFIDSLNIDRRIDDEFLEIGIQKTKFTFNFNNISFECECNSYREGLILDIGNDIIETLETNAIIYSTESPLNGYYSYKGNKISKEDNPNVYHINLTLSNNIAIMDKDIEQFSNNLIANIKSVSKDYFYFDILKGKDIAQAYDSSNFAKNIGTIKNSCMNGKQDFMDIYFNNDNISMIVLRDKETDKIYGRALLWKLDYSVKGAEYFLDRPYYVNDSDVGMLQNYAIDNGYIYRTSSTENYSIYFNGEKEKSIKMECTISVPNGVEKSKFPFIDTLSYGRPESDTNANNPKSITLSNVPTGAIYVFHSQKGTYDLNKKG